MTAHDVSKIVRSSRISTEMDPDLLQKICNLSTDELKSYYYQESILANLSTSRIHSETDMHVCELDTLSTGDSGSLIDASNNRLNVL